MRKSTARRLRDAEQVLALGVDIGTTGVRTAVVDARGRILSSARKAHLSPQDGDVDAEDWWQAVRLCLGEQVAGAAGAGIDTQQIARIAVDGTSGTMVLVDGALVPVTPALMYDSAGFDDEAARIAEHAEADSIARGAGSAVARMLRLQSLDGAGAARHLLHQADFVLARLAGRAVGSDENNALKLGHDPAAGAWPGWFARAGIRRALLPEVHPAGAAVSAIDRSVACSLGLSPDLVLHAGTTDSIAAFLAAGACMVGDAVTSLGTTLAIKILSASRVDAPDLGIYSHRLGSNWLAGGASNTGGGVLAAHFRPEEIEALSSEIDPGAASGLDYYPLKRPGERFPVRDPALEPRLTPRPESPVRFLQGMLEGMAEIERRGYGALESLGAPAPRRIFTAGGGARNAAWTEIRRKRIPAEFVDGREHEACVGAARLALGLFGT